MQIIFRFIMWLSGIWLLFNIPDFKNYFIKNTFDLNTLNLSVIIPARNEEKRLPALLNSLSKQKIKPLEIIVVDDDSRDNTYNIACEAGCIVHKADELPQGWQGKSWACWIGALKSKGDTLLFLDADTSIENDGLKKILTEYSNHKSPLSIQPYHNIKKIYENFSAIFNIIVMMGTNLFTPLGSKIKASVFFGPCQVISKKDYFHIGGHMESKGDILDDIALGKNFLKHKIPIKCMSGRGAISFRMYPGGINEIIQGWSKNFASGAKSIGLINLILISFWITGAIGTYIMLIKTLVQYTNFPFIPLFLYLLYGLQVFWMLYRIGSFSPFIITFYPIAFLFFVVVFVRGTIMTFFLKRVEWKDRVISTKKGKMNK